MQEHGQRALERRNAQLVAEQVAREKAKQEEAEKKKAVQESFRFWFPSLISLAALIVSVVSLLRG